MTRRSFFAAVAGAIVAARAPRLAAGSPPLVEVAKWFIDEQPFLLAVGDIVTFGDWPERYVVTAAASSHDRITDARFAQVDRLPRVWPLREKRIGDKVFRAFFRESMNLLPENLRSGRWRWLTRAGSVFD
jgi:hypothetical protein